jgi:hypothetical protein
MPRAPATAQKDRTDQQLAAGRGDGDFVPSIKSCTIEGCPYTARLGPSMDEHIASAKHIACPRQGCNGSYSSTMRTLHDWKSHGIKGPITTGRLVCRYAGCEFSTNEYSKRNKHEDEIHVECDVDGCEFRGSREQFTHHERWDHEADTPRVKSGVL